MTLTDADRDQARRVARATLATRAFVLFIGVALTAVLVAQTVLAVQDHRRIEQNKVIQQFIKDQAIQNGAVGKQIRSCTDPAGECYKRGQQQTATAVADIGNANLLIVVCALAEPKDTPVDVMVAEVSACVRAQLDPSRR